jgi:eukaryotic-like serine/threonine-protein kinase
MARVYSQAPRSATPRGWGSILAVSLSPGTQVGPYQITGTVGSGGMGEVYRARDPRLGRDVALKVLPASFAEDPERLRRFEQEARATSQLNHPNILAIHDLGTFDGAPFVVSELLEGETLRDRIGATPLPLRKAVDYGTQIARGLAAAHEKGIVHRDLKPDNLFITRDGRAKILDFGLAKLIGVEGLSEGETNTAGAGKGTDAGKVLGTVGYMSPEQVRAHPVDHRSDIFSFGAVLYEMLSGKRAFRGASAVETMNAILKEDPPPLTETNRQLPPGLERIITHCLEKSPEERFQSARDIAFDLELLSGSTTTAVAPLDGSRRGRFGRPALVLAGAVALATLGFVAGRYPRRTAVPTFERLTYRHELIPLARFGPDGRTVVYESTSASGVPEILTAEAGSPESRSVGIGDAKLSAVSSKGELLVRIRHDENARTLARAPMSGGAPREVLENVESADWGPDGASMAVTRWAGSSQTLEFPIGRRLFTATEIKNVRVSPGADLVAFTEHPVFGDGRGDVSIVDLGGKRTVLSAGWADLGALAWAPDGHEIFFTAVRSGTEHSVHAVDLAGHERLVYQVPGSVDVLDVASDGRVLLSMGHGQPQILGRAPGDSKERDLSWLDYGYVRGLSRDGKTLLFEEEGRGGGPEYSTYVRGTNGSPPVRLGSGSARDLSPDGKWVLVLDLKASTQVVLLPTGTGEPRPLPRGTLDQIHYGTFSADGQRVFLLANEARKEPRLWEQTIAGGDPRPLTAEGLAGVASPDGRHAAVYTKANQLELLEIGKAEPRPLAGLLPSDDVFRFTADSRAMIVRGLGERPARIFKVFVDTGKREPLAEIGPGEGTTGKVASVDVTDDGKVYAYTHFDKANTLYVAQGLR